MSEKDALTNTAEHDLTSTLRRLADRLPICSQELEKAEVKGDTLKLPTADLKMLELTAK